MAISITDANVYIDANVIDVEDWQDADEAKKTRLLNVAQRTLTTQFSRFTIPDAAVYETAAAFATAFSDTMAQAQRGVQTFSLSGVASFTFKYGTRDLTELIPQTALDQISTENGGVPLSKRRVGWTVL